MSGALESMLADCVQRIASKARELCEDTLQDNNHYARVDTELLSQLRALIAEWTAASDVVLRANRVWLQAVGATGAFTLRSFTLVTDCQARTLRAADILALARLKVGEQHQCADGWVLRRVDAPKDAQS